VRRLSELIQQALMPVPARRKTKPPASAVEKRLAEKKHRSKIKQQRAEKHQPDQLY